MSYRHRKAALLLALAAVPSGGHAALKENSAASTMPRSKSFCAALGGRCRRLKTPSSNTYRRSGRGRGGPGYTPPKRHAQIEPGRAVGSIVSSRPAGPHRRAGGPRRATALRSPLPARGRRYQLPGRGRRQQSMLGERPRAPESGAAWRPLVLRSRRDGTIANWPLEQTCRARRVCPNFQSKEPSKTQQTPFTV